VTDAQSTETAERRGWMRVLAAADREALSAAWGAVSPQPEVLPVRGPEAGLVMVQGRMDGSGPRFHLGEATVVRATVRLHGGPLAEDVLGTSYLLGTDLEHARLAAAFDGLLADETLRENVLDEVIRPLEREQAERDRARQAEARGTLVDFFTVAREHA
jgi:alpha-D-ribose 1-methylphosphonate 5-triphosphate synthase subunit PhnG